MTPCLVCQQEIVYQMSLKQFFIGRYQKDVLCQNCLKQANILEVCHEQFLLKKHYYYYHALAMYYAPIIKKYKKYVMITHPPLLSANQPLADYTYKIIHKIHAKCVSIDQMPKIIRANELILCVDYNGICVSNWEKMPRKDNIMRLTLWRNEYGTI